MGPHHTSIKEIMSYLNEPLPYQRTGRGGTAEWLQVSLDLATVDVSSWGMLRIMSSSLPYWSTAIAEDADHGGLFKNWWRQKWSPSLMLLEILVALTTECLYCTLHTKCSTLTGFTDAVRTATLLYNVTPFLLPRSSYSGLYLLFFL